MDFFRQQPWSYRSQSTPPSNIRMTIKIRKPEKLFWNAIRREFFYMKVFTISHYNNFSNINAISILKENQYLSHSNKYTCTNKKVLSVIKIRSFDPVLPLKKQDI